MKVVNPRHQRLKIDGVVVDLAPLRSKDRVVLDEALKALHANPSDLVLAEDVRLTFRIAMARQIKAITIHGKPWTLEFCDGVDELTQRCVERLLSLSSRDFIRGLSEAIVDLVYDDEPFEIADKDANPIDGIEVLPDPNRPIN